MKTKQKIQKTKTTIRAQILTTIESFKNENNLEFNCKQLLDSILQYTEKQKVFIDIGSGNFNGLKKYINDLDIDDSWDVRCYELDESVFFASYPIANTLPKFKNFTYENLGVSAQSGFHEAKLVKMVQRSKGSHFETKPFGSSTIANIDHWGNFHSVKYDTKNVKCIGIHNLLVDIFKDYFNPYIVMKVDVQGDEKKLFNALLSSPLYKKISKIFIKWNPNLYLDQEDYLENKKYILKQMRINNRNLEINNHIL